MRMEVVRYVEYQDPSRLITIRRFQFKDVRGIYYLCEISDDEPKKIQDRWYNLRMTMIDAARKNMEVWISNVTLKYCTVNVEPTSDFKIDVIANGFLPVPAPQTDDSRKDTHG